jgi:hypothetical protein
MSSLRLYGGEWVWIRNGMNSAIKCCDPCSVCQRASCAKVWVSIKTQEVRCSYHPPVGVEV